MREPDRLSNFFIAAMLALTSGLALAINPYNIPDNAWITTSGIIIDSNKRSFTLDYGDGTIKVNMTDRNDYESDWPITTNNRVTVHGRINDDFIRKPTIEADKIYIHDQNIYFYASSTKGRDLTEQKTTTPKGRHYS